MFHLSYIHPAAEMAHANHTIVYAEENQSNQGNNEPTQEQRMNQSVLLNKVIIGLDIWKLVMFAFLVQSQLEPFEGSELRLYSWCQKIAFVAMLEICLKLYCIRKETLEIEQLKVQSQNSSYQLEENYVVSFNQPLVGNGQQENLELIPILTDFDVSKLKLYFFFRIRKTETLLTILIAIIHFILFVYGNVIVFNMGDMQKTFIYKTASIYLLIKRLTNIEIVNKENILTTYHKKECSICLRHYNLEDTVVTLPCNSNHNFHKDCIMKWLKINTTCPTCRYDLTQQAIELKTVARNSSLDYESQQAIFQ